MNPYKNEDLKAAELTVLITAHCEGNMLYTALLSFAMARDHAEMRGARIRFIIVLDRADAATCRAVHGHPALRVQDRITAVEFGDTSEARNHAVALAAPGLVATLDGDDLVSEGYFSMHLLAANAGSVGDIWHPEFVVSFGAERSVTRQPSQIDDTITPGIMVAVNPWTSAAVADREIFLRVPYRPCRTSKTGFGYEDWHWNCETMALGYRHVIAQGSAYYYRKKSVGSVNMAARNSGVLLPPTKLLPPWGETWT